MAKKTEEQLRTEQAELAASKAAVDRQIASLELGKVQAFVDALAIVIPAEGLTTLELAASGLPDFAGRYAANLIDVFKATPSLMAMEVDRLQRAAAEPVAPPVQPEPVA
jgi:hypothetical protein